MVFSEEVSDPSSSSEAESTVNVEDAMQVWGSLCMFWLMLLYHPAGTRPTATMARCALCSSSSHCCLCVSAMYTSHPCETSSAASLWVSLTSAMQQVLCRFPTAVHFPQRYAYPL